MFSLLELVGPIAPLKIVDVGAMSIGGGATQYDALLKTDGCQVIGFEPQPDECARLNQMHGDRHQYLPYVIGDGGTYTFHQCASPATSSVYRPNEKLLQKFGNLAELCRVVKQYPVTSKRLDEIPEVWEADYLKLDVQGAEVDVLLGAKRLLKSVVVVHTEVEFVPLYTDQPLFADVDQLLRQHGFLFYRFYDTASYNMPPFNIRDEHNQPVGQTLWTDAVYLKSFMQFDELPAKKLLNLALILHELYRALDLAYAALKQYDQKTGADLAATYLAQIQQTSTK